MLLGMLTTCEQKPSFASLQILDLCTSNTAKKRQLSQLSCCALAQMSHQLVTTRGQVKSQRPTDGMCRSNVTC